MRRGPSGSGAAGRAGDTDPQRGGRSGALQVPGRGDGGDPPAETARHGAGTVPGVRALVQRVSRASVTVRDDRGGEELVGAIEDGLCVLVGVTHADGAAEAAKLAARLWHLRIFADDAGAMNRSVAECGSRLLVVSQFTLYANTERGRRPSFLDGARPDVAQPLVDRLVAELAGLGATVATGRFGAHMAIGLVNDGPVTVLLE